MYQPNLSTYVVALPMLAAALMKGNFKMIIILPKYANGSAKDVLSVGFPLTFLGNFNLFISKTHQKMAFSLQMQVVGP